MLKGKNKRKMFKKALCLSFALLICINTFAAVVSDNDGSAFITKAEFDSLKNNFQASLDQYNSNIDRKIDDAIAQYLNGIKISKETTLTSLYNNLGGESIQWYKGMNLWKGNTKRPRARLATFFECWPQPDYWNRYKNCYYRMASQQTLQEVDENKGGGIIAHTVNNSSGLVPLSSDKKALLQFKSEDGMCKLEKYLEYAILYEAWGIYYNSVNPTENATITVSFNNCKNDKTVPGTMTFTQAYREASEFRINELNTNVRDLSYAMFTTAMTRENIMIDDTEFKKKSEELLNSWESDMTSTVWQKNPSPNSAATYEFVSAKYTNFCDYKYWQDSSGNWLTKPWEVLHYGHSLKDYPVRMYEGIPICKSQATGNIVIKSLTPSISKSTFGNNFYFSIASSPFSNIDIRSENKNILIELDESTETVSETDDTKAYEKVVNGDTFYYRLNKPGAKISFDSKKDTSYYIKFLYAGATSQWAYFTVDLGEISETSE
jgi:hypothetical protein